MGAFPWVVMQLMLVAMVIFWPESVTYWLEKTEMMDADKVMEQLESMAHEGDGADSPASGPEDAASEPGAVEMPAPEASDAAAEDPMKAIEQAVEPEKKP